MRDFFEYVVIPILLLIGILIFTSFLMSIPIWISSCHQAKLFNLKNNTSYTCSDFFWASEQINTQIQTIKLEK